MTYLLTYLLTYLPTYLLTYLLAYLLTYLRYSAASVSRPAGFAAKMKVTTATAAATAGYAGAGPQSSSVEERIMGDFRKVLAKNVLRLDNLFRKWDLNGDGAIDRREWAQALPLIGVNTNAAIIDRLFDEVGHGRK